MNKLCYRIVFNQTRGLWMAVAETARARAKAPGHTRSTGRRQPLSHLPALHRVAVLLAGVLGGMLFACNVAAQIIADVRVPGQQRATVVETANGVTQVNIQTASAAGVSRNVYSQFDVAKNGIVLNNSRTNVQTQIGGWVQGNPWLAKGTARVILNEVNSSSPSRLQGMIEVAGDRAEAIIANPAGIVVEGGGFINVSRATLTTGTPIVEDGGLRGYSVQRGQIVFGGAGFDASKTDYTAVIARSVQVNAGLWAQKLHVITGINEIEAATEAKVTAGGQSTDGKPLFAVDVAQLGGMYANHIYLVGTEAGVGVRNAGDIGAAVGSLVVTADGRLENSGSMTANERVQVRAASVDNRGDMQARGALDIVADKLANAGKLKSVEALLNIQGTIDNSHGQIEAARVDLQSAALLNLQGSIVQSGPAPLAISAEKTINEAGTLGHSSASASADAGGAKPAETAQSGTPSQAGTPSPTTGQTPAGATAQPPVPEAGRISSKLFDNSAGVIASNGEVTLKTVTLNNRGGNTYVSNLSVDGPQVDNTGGLLTVLHGFDARAGTFINDQGKLLVGAAFNGAAGAFSNRQGLLQAGQMSIDVTGTLDNSGGILRQLGGAIADIGVGGELSLEGGALEAAGSMRLRAGAISGSGSTLDVTGDLDLVSGITSSAHGRWIVGGDANVRATALDNSAGTIAARDINVVAGGVVDNSAGLLQASRKLTLDTSGKIVNQGGRIEALADDSTLRLSAAAIDNGNGQIINAGAGKLLVESVTVRNDGLIGGNGGIEIAAHALTNGANATIRSQQSIELAVDTALENAGRIDAGGLIQMRQAGALLQNSGTLVAAGDINIAVDAVDNRAGTIATAAGLGADLHLQAASLRNQGGLIDVDGRASITSAEQVDNQGGHIRAGRDLALSAGTTIGNDSGAIDTSGQLRLHSGDIANHGGKIVSASAQPMLIDADRAIDNGGVVSSNGALAVRADQFDNGAGTVSVGADLSFDVSNKLINGGGTISAAGIITVDRATAQIVNSGTLISGAGVRLSVDDINNDGGVVSTLQDGSVVMDVNSLSNRGGKLIAGADIAVRAQGTIDNTGGRAQAAGSLDISAGGILHNQAGVIEAAAAHGRLAVSASTIDNTAGRVVNAGDGVTSVTAVDHVESTGLIAGNGALNLAAATLSNAGTFSSGSDLELAVSQFLTNGGIISAVKGMHMDQAGASLRNSGTMVAGSGMDLTVKSIDNAGGRIATGHDSNADVRLYAQDLANVGGTVVSDRDARISISNNIDNRAGVVQAKQGLAIVAAGSVDTGAGSIETMSDGSTLRLDASAVLNDGGRIVNAGRGDTVVQAATRLTNSGQIAGHGAVELAAQSMANDSTGVIAAGDALALRVHAAMVNAGAISSGAALTFDEAAATLSNHGTMVATGDISVRVVSIDNANGTLATTSGSGAGVDLKGESLSNRSGAIAAEGALTVDVLESLDNTAGKLRAGGSLQVRSGGDVINDGGSIEASGAGANLVLQAGAIRSREGRIVNVGDGVTRLQAATTIESSGIIAGNGALALHAAQLDNQAGGTLASLGAMTVDVFKGLDNGGTIQSGAALDIAAQAADVRNAGLIASGGLMTLTSALLNNDHGQLATAEGSHANLVLDAAAISNRAGVIVSDALAQVRSSGRFDNTHGTLQSAASMDLAVAGVVSNGGGVVETLAPNAALALRASALDNGNGRIVNVGAGNTTIVVAEKASSSGVIAGNGGVSLTAAELDNQAGASLAAGTTLGLFASGTIANAGEISSGDGMLVNVNVRGGALRNSGHIISGASALVDAALIDNSGGQLGSAAGGHGDVVLHAGQIVNGDGSLSADGALQIVSAAMLDNRHGQLRANTAMSVDAAGDVLNRDGVIEVTGADAGLRLNAAAIDNTAGRLVNVGTGTTRISAVEGIVNDGTLAGNGSVALHAATIDNGESGSISSARALDLHVGQALNNKGIISAAGALTMDEATAHIANSGKMVASDGITLHGASISNDGGHIGSSGGADNAVVLSSESSLSNRGGVIVSAGNLTVSTRGDYDNNHGQVQTPGRLQVTSGGDLNNAGGVMEAVGSASVLALQGATVDNTAGRIVNVGLGDTTVASSADLLNGGTIAVNGALTVSAATLSNASSGVIEAGSGLELAVAHELINAGTINSHGGVHFDHATASLSNTGTIGAGGAIDINVDRLDNLAGRLYTASGSGAAITIRANRLDNAGGIVAADALL
ncbi:filamentous hemagglutinin N-terminal domain-containing protein [Massilia sp. PWRC2]|uniref:two-partner secretion domain-containing protein n=1 Tax=Massilia sp. PWRC2 TaxID=2804626 RepID=UPI003CE755AE